MSSNIKEQHRVAFEALVSGAFANFALFSCFVNGTSGAAFVAVSQGETPDHEITITPLFVSVSDDMILTCHERRAA